MPRYKASDVTVFADMIGTWLTRYTNGVVLHPIPRGGYPVAYAIQTKLRQERIPCRVSSEPPSEFPARYASILVDDVVASGATMRRYLEAHKYQEAVALVTKQWPVPEMSVNVKTAVVAPDWVVFPWEQSDENTGPEDAVRRLIEYAGGDPNDENFKDTPRRVLAFYDELRAKREADLTLTTFEDKYDDLMLVRGIPLTAVCPHHMMPWIGTASIGYIPEQGRVLGLSKIARIVQQLQSGLIMQETLTRGISEAVENATGSSSVAVLTTAQHTCMIARGVRAHSAETVVSAMLGKFRDNHALRAEFIALNGKG